MQKDQGKNIPTLVARDHESCYTHAFTCPGDSAKEDEYSEDIVHKCKMLVEMLGYKRVAMKSDQETAMTVLQQRVQKAVNVEMVFTNSKRYDAKSNGKVERPSRRLRGISEHRNSTLRIVLAKRFPLAIRSSIGWWNMPQT